MMGNSTGTLASKGFCIDPKVRDELGDVRASDFRKSVALFLGVPDYDKEQLRKTAFLTGLRETETSITNLFAMAKTNSRYANDIADWVGYSPAELWPTFWGDKRLNPKNRRIAREETNRSDGVHCPKCWALTGGDDCWQCRKCADPNWREKEQARKFASYQRSYSPAALRRIVDAGIINEAVLLPIDKKLLPPARASQPSQLATHAPLAETSQLISSAEAFRAAIAALPVGKDIRGRLTVLLDAHIAKLGGATA